MVDDAIGADEERLEPAVGIGGDDARRVGGGSPFAPLGGSLSPGPVGIGITRDGRLEVFARRTDFALGTTWRTASNGGWAA